MKELTKKVEQLKYEFTDKQVSPWGGLRLISALFAKLGLEEELRELPLPQPGSNRGYEGIEIIKTFIVSILIGANRYSHCALLEYDEVVKEIFRIEKVPSQSTFSRYFRKFSCKLNNKIFPKLSKWIMEKFGEIKVTIDLDSTVIERYGKQEGSKRGYNPKKPGRPSQHPFVAFIPELKLTVNGWLRPGDTHASNNFMNFMEETIDIVGQRNIGLVRADSGFFSEKCLEYLESKGLNYIISAKLYKPLKELLISQLKWIPIEEGIEVSEIKYRLNSWKTERRFVVVRKDVKIYPESTGVEIMPLFPEISNGRVYRYNILVTNTDLPPYTVWEIYRKRSDSENRIKELKYDFAITGFSSKEFYATEAAFRFALFVYNIMALFRLIALKDKRVRRMTTIYFQCIALGSWLVRKGGKVILKLSVKPERRAWIKGLFENIDNFSPPLAISNA